ncbi:tetratricopeptide repeat protein [Acidobacteriota bacterium]
MKLTNLYFLGFLAMVLVLVPVYLTAQGTQSADVLLGTALHQEEVEGDYEAAIETYKKLLAEFPDNRPLAARAQFRIGVCFEKLGFEEAEKAFQKVVDNYPDQTEAVKMAREKLSILERARTIIEKEEQGITMTELPIDPEKNRVAFAFISPDGKKLASVDGPGDIWITDIASGKRFQLTKTPAYDYWCSWSPDSQKIAYLNYGGNVFVASAQEGGAKNQIEIKPGFDKEGWFSSWSPDSQRVNLWFSKQGLYSIPISGGEWKEIFKYSDPQQAETHSNLLLSPNEKYLLYSDRTGNKDIYIMPVEGGEPVQITNHPADDCVELWFGTQWSYDGRWILFSSTRNGNYEPWIIGIGPDGKRRGEPFQIPYLSKASAILYTWTEGGQIGLSVGKSITNLFVSNLNGEEEVQLTNVEKTELGPRWSPDNKYIAYISSDFGANRKVWIVPVQGGESQKISGHLTTRPGVGVIYFIAWHPDGRNVSCTVTAGEDNAPWMVDIQSGVAHKIPFDYDGRMEGAMDWSPNGERFAFKYKGEEGTQNSIKDSDVEHWNIYTMPSGGGDAVKVTRVKDDVFDFGNPRWSPDGKTIACEADNRIWIVSSEGGEPQAITEKKGGINGFCWSPDGETIYFARTEGKEIQCYSVSSQGGELRKMEIENISDISPDGKKMVYTKHLKTINQYWLLENFLPEKK